MITPPTIATLLPIYSELGIGYADTRYNKEYLNKQTLSVAQSATDNLNHGFGATGDLGYQFLPYMLIEGGVGYLPEYMATMSSQDYNVKSWFFYGAVRLSVTMANDTVMLYVKPGLAYRDIRLSIDSSNYNSYYNAFYGAGGTHTISIAMSLLAWNTTTLIKSLTCPARSPRPVDSIHHPELTFILLKWVIVKPCFDYLLIAPPTHHPVAMAALDVEAMVVAYTLMLDFEDLMSF